MVNLVRNNYTPLPPFVTNDDVETWALDHAFEMHQEASYRASFAAGYSTVHITDLASDTHPDRVATARYAICALRALTCPDADIRAFFASRGVEFEGVSRLV